MPVSLDQLPLVGSLVPISRDALRFFTRVLRERGDRVPLRVLGRKVLLLCHPDDLEQVLVRDREVFGRSSEIRKLKPIFGDGLLSSEDPTWRRQRTMIQPSFQHEAMATYAETMLSVIRGQLREWRTGESRDIYRDMMRYTRETICDVLFGSQFTGDHAEVGEAVSIVFGDLQAEILYLPVWRRLPLARSRRWNRAVNLLNCEVDRQIALRVEASSPGDNLLGALLRARDAEGAGMSREQVHDEILTFFLAGHETAALSLTWATCLLATHPEVQERAAQEVLMATAGRPLQAKDYGRLPYLTAVVKETLRLYPPVWSIGRKARRDVLLGNEPVAEGTDLWLCVQRLHRDPRWYEEPDEFLPERWLGDVVQRRFTYMPFGIGPRVCIGQHFAMAETVLGLAMMLQRYRLSLVSSSPAEVSAWITLRPKQAIRLRVEER